VPAIELLPLPQPVPAIELLPLPQPVPAIELLPLPQPVPAIELILFDCRIFLFRWVPRYLFNFVPMINYLLSPVAH
jgi:hypothetical protein